MASPIVCSSPAGSLWLLLGQEAGGTRWLNLETGEVRDMERHLSYLMNWGWRLVEGDLAWHSGWSLDPP